MRTIANWGYWLVRWLGAGVAWLFDPDRRIQTIVLAMSITTAVLVAAQSVQNQVTAAQEHAAAKHSQEITACQSAYNQAIARITHVRAQLNDEDRDAVKTLNLKTAQFIFGVSTPTPGLTQAQKIARFERLVTQYRKSVTDYRNRENRIDLERASHPVPLLPPGACE